jgi:cell wall-associated NlpC family hydrolase
MPIADDVTLNKFVPSIVVPNDHGQSVVNPDLDMSTRKATEQNFSSLMRNNAYQRLDESPLAKQNPPFNYGSAGRLFHPISDSPIPLSPRISRGYIRRSASNKLDPTDGYRLYFMYNPTSIQRDYVAYLEQQALDPFNTIYGSNNLVAPPGILDFSFELMFDRQVENANGSMPRGVLEDFDYFDLVIRGVVPDNQGPHMQDNGIMMINPRNVTIVFSPQLSVQGRPYRAAVQYTKFDHNMIPIRMTIAISMKVFYFGKIREDFAFAASNQEATYSSTVPYKQPEVTVTTIELETKLRNSSGGTASTPNITPVFNISDPVNSKMREDVLDLAKTQEGKPYVYGAAGPDSYDCSGLVYWSYNNAGYLNALVGRDTFHILPKAINMGTVIASSSTGPYTRLDASYIDNGGLEYGDLMLAADTPNGAHMGFIIGANVDTKQVVSFESTGDHVQYQTRSYNDFLAWFNYIIRPAIAGTQTTAGGN